MHSDSQLLPTEPLLGIDFFNGKLDQAVDAVAGGGLFLMPSGPGLATLDRKTAYREALEQADVVLLDSGFLALLARFTRGKRLTRISGYRFLEALLAGKQLKTPDATFWVMPDATQADAFRVYLREHGLEVREEQIYIAPVYDREQVEDEELLKRVRLQQPRAVFICLGGDIQEPLGHRLKTRLAYRPAIICSGAAIAFLAGTQAGIPKWADRLMLGWLCRILHHPGRFLPRYLRAFRLVYLYFKMKHRSVVSEGKTP